MQQETIAAISTPPGEGGIAIIRVSGSESISQVATIFKPRRPGRSLHEMNGYNMILGWIVDEQDQPIDECLLAVMRKPHSYTAEDTVEIYCHGGVIAAQQCLKQVLKQGIRQALPGEFTQQAYLNGRLDASQAEAVIEIIRARSEKALALAMKQLSGFNSRYIGRMEDRLVEATALIEGSIDFPEDVGEPDYEYLAGLLHEIQADLDRLLLAGKRAEVFRSGVKVVICGKPNVGKSSLLNWLSGRKRAIVTEIPGTTRDTIEEYINIRGIPVRIIDTAGIRETEDKVEAVGVQMAQQAISESDLAIFLLDITTGITSEDEKVFGSLNPSRTILFINKDDLIEKKIGADLIQAKYPGIPVIIGSIQQEEGLDELQEQIEGMVLEGIGAGVDLEIILSARQQLILQYCQSGLESVVQILASLPLDCLAVEISDILEKIGELTGKNIKTEAINKIFEDFCIGK